MTIDDADTLLVAQQRHAADGVPPPLMPGGRPRIGCEERGYTLFALSPLFYISLFIGALISPAIRTFPDTNETPEQVFIGGFMLVSLLAYIWDIWTNARMPKTKRALWTAVMFRGTGLPFPFVSGTTFAVLDLTMVINPRLTPHSSGPSPAAGC